MAYRRAAATLGRNLRALRTGQRWTLERAAEAADMDPTQLAKIEAGTVNVTLVTLPGSRTALVWRWPTCSYDASPSDDWLAAVVMVGPSAHSERVATGRSRARSGGRGFWGPGGPSTTPEGVTTA